jgi:LysR family hydrogen peroxide-inducible transcriptional activator
MFLNTFLKKYPLLEVTIEELTTEQVLKKIKDGNLDAGIAATPLNVDYLIERPLYYEPFVAYVPGNHKLFSKESIKVADIDPDDVLLLQDGHCFRNQVLNLCSTSNNKKPDKIKLQSGSFETIIKLTQEGMGMTLLPYLHTLDLNEKERKFLHNFEAPSPAREISLVYNKNELKLHIIDALRSLIASVIRGAIAFNNVKIIDPKKETLDCYIRQYCKLGCFFT